MSRWVREDCKPATDRKPIASLDPHDGLARTVYVDAFCTSAQRMPVSLLGTSRMRRLVRRHPVVRPEKEQSAPRCHSPTPSFNRGRIMSAQAHATKAFWISVSAASVIIVGLVKLDGSLPAWVPQVVVTLAGLVGISWFAGRRLDLFDKGIQQRQESATTQLRGHGEGQPQRCVQRSRSNDGNQLPFVNPRRPKLATQNRGWRPKRHRTGESSSLQPSRKRHESCEVIRRRFRSRPRGV